MPYPKEGVKQQFRAGQFLIAPQLGSAGYIRPSYLLSGEVVYICKSTSGNTIEIKRSPGSLIGLECLYTQNYPVVVMAKSAVEVMAWDPEAFEICLGKDIEFAVSAIISMSQHQRQVNDELAFRVQYQQRNIRDSATVLYLLGQENYHWENWDIAAAYFERICLNYPHSPYRDSAEGFLAQIQHRRQKENPQFQLQDDSANLTLDTQQNLFHLAFYGVSAISAEIFKRFGKTYAPGEILFKEGEPGQELYFILEGSVEVSRAGQPITHLTEGDIFGEMALFEKKPRSATVKAAEPLKVLALTETHFRMIFQLHPSWSLQLIRGFALRIANCYELLGR